MNPNAETSMQIIINDITLLSLRPKMDRNRFELFWKKHRRLFSITDILFRIIGLIVVILIIIETTSFLIISMNTQDTTDYRIHREVYENETWAEDYFSEFQESFSKEYYPYVGFRRVPDYTGRHININRDSIRSTHFQCPAEHTYVIYFFGGSTAWGSGVRDQGTIPSLLSKKLCEQGYNVQMTNFGESGYTSTQEIIRLLLELQKGNQPDIVIFYDGFNDVNSAKSNLIAGYPYYVSARKKEFNSHDNLNIAPLFNDFYKLTDKYIPKQQWIEPQLDIELAHDTAHLYLKNNQIIRAMENEFDFKSFFFWQPTIYTKQVLSPDEKNNINMDSVLEDYYGEVSKMGFTFTYFIL